MPPDTSAPGQRSSKERDGLDERLGEARVLLDPGRHGEDVRVEDDVLGPEPGLGDQQVVGAAQDLDLPLDGLGLAALVEGHDHDPRAVAADRPRLLEEDLLALLQRDRVDDPLALEALEPRLERREAGAVDHDRQARSLRLGRDQVEERGHRLLGVEQVGVHVHVEQVRSAAHLLERDGDTALEVVRLDEPAELRRARDVRPLAHHDEARVRADDERLETGEARQPRGLRHVTGRKPFDRSRDLARVLRRRPAAAADEVDETVLGEGAQEPARIPRLLVVEPERVRQARVRMAGDVGRGDVREALEERPHLGRAERAVDSDDERLCVLDRDPERLGRLAGQIAPAPVDGGEREPERELGRDVTGRDDRRLRVQRVEDRLDHEQVDASVAQSGDLLLVRLPDLIEGHRPVRGVLDARRERESDVERAERARDEAWPLGCRLRPLVGRSPREPRAFEAHLGSDVLEVVVRLPDTGRREGVRRRDVGARREVRVVDLGDDLRMREVQEIRVALDVLVVSAESARRGTPPPRGLGDG